MRGGGTSSNKLSPLAERILSLSLALSFAQNSNFLSRDFSALSPAIINKSIFFQDITETRRRKALQTVQDCSVLILK